MSKKPVRSIESKSVEILSFGGVSSVFISLIMFFLPLVITNGYYNITATKYYFFVIVAVIYVVSFLFFSIYKFNSIKNQKISFKAFSDVTFTDISFILFFLFSLISAFLSDYSEDVWVGSGSRYQGIITLFLYFSVYFIVSRNFPKNINFLFFAICAFDLVSIIGLLNCFGIDLFGIYKHLTAGQMAAYVSTIGNINFYSSYICLLLPLTLCGFCQSEEKFNKYFYGLSLVTGTLGMMVTSSESFVVGFVFSIAVIPLFFLNDLFKFKKFLIGAIIIIATSQCFHFLYNITSERVNVRISALLSLFLKPYIAIPLLVICSLLLIITVRRPETIKLLKYIYFAVFSVSIVAVIVTLIMANSVLLDKNLGILNDYLKITPEWGTDRGKIWIHCIEIFKELPLKNKLFGVGPEALYHFTSGVFDKRLDQAHCEYLQYLLTTGVLGVTSYLLLIVSVIYVMVKHLFRNPLAVGLFSGLVSYWVQATVNIAQPFTTPIMYIYIACIAGIYFSTRKNNTEMQKIENSRKKR